MSRSSVSSTLIGNSGAMNEVRVLIDRFAPSSLPVFVEGPTGTGKELIAQALHRSSGRSGSLVSVNVCAIAESMFEATLFGYVRGAFTGAVSDSPGYLAEADRGTLFLDEIGGLPITLQAKLLRAIETGDYRPVGARSDRHSDFRVVCAANEPLQELVQQNRFRADLAYRLRVGCIRVPPLSERLSDVPLLAQHFVSSRAEMVALCSSALEALQGLDWPGNVRELQSVVEAALVLRADTERLCGTDIARALGQHRNRIMVSPSPSDQRNELLDLLRECGWNRSLAARRLGVDRTTVWRRMRRFGLFSDATLSEVALAPASPSSEA